jgi:Holliday junction DNA helicase RuvA
MLSGMPAAELIAAIRSNDLVRLTAIPGVGKKTAERVVVELRDKVAAISIEEAEAGATVSQVGGFAEEAIRSDTVEALMALGYPKAVAEKAVTAAMREEGDRSIEAVLKRSLKRLSR